MRDLIEILQAQVLMAKVKEEKVEDKSHQFDKKVEDTLDSLCEVEGFFQF